MLINCMIREIMSEETFQKVDDWVRKYNEKARIFEKIEAIYYGYMDVKENKKRLFLITNQVFPPSLEKAIKEFDLVKLEIWPCGYKNAEHSNFEKIFDYVEEITSLDSL